MRILIRFSLVLTLVGSVLLSVPAALRAQEILPVDMGSVLRIIDGDLPLREIGVDAALSERLYSYSSPNGAQAHVLLTSEGDLLSRPRDLALDVPTEQIKWVGLATRARALELLDGIYLDASWRQTNGGDGLIELLDGSFHDGKMTVFGIDTLPIAQPVDVPKIMGTDEPTPETETVVQTISEAPTQLMSGLYGPDVWRLRPDLILRQAESRGASQILIDLPMTQDMSFPLYSIELRRLLRVAAVDDIDVWVRPSVNALRPENDLARILAGIGAFNAMAKGLKRDTGGAIAGVYLSYSPQKPDHEILSPEGHQHRLVEAIASLSGFARPDGEDALDLTLELPYMVWQQLDGVEKERLENAAQIGLVVSEAEAADLMQPIAEMPSAATLSIEDIAARMFEGNDETAEAGVVGQMAEAVSPRYHLVFKSTPPKATARMHFVRANPGRLHIYFQGERAVLLVLAAPVPARGGSSFILDYLESPLSSADNYFGRETEMWAIATNYSTTAFDFSLMNAIFMGSIVVETD